MNLILFGGSGMVGGGILRECLADPRVESVLSVGRRTCGVADPKLRELIRPDLLDLDDARGDLTGYQACFFCLGVSSAGMSEADYRRVTLDLTIAAATILGEVNPGLTFCYVSAQGSDRSGRSRFMWARVRGETENQLLQMPFPAYTFRPGLIQPSKGVPSKTIWVRVLYNVLAPLFPVLNRLFPNQVTTTGRIGRAMIRAATIGSSSQVLETRDINALAASV
ncbi:epimerase [Gemmatimonadota bacterium]